MLKGVLQAGKMIPGGQADLHTGMGSTGTGTFRAKYISYVFIM